MTKVRIIGLDPGLNNTGWGVVEVQANRLAYVASGTIRPKSGYPLSARLHQLFTLLCDVIDTYAPQEASIEETFVNKGARSALVLGQARGIVLMAPEFKNVSAYEYAANLVKKSVVGHGHADKNQIGHMIKMLLPHANPKNTDEADALAIAICHAHHRTMHSLRGCA